MSEEVPAPAPPTQLEREITQAERWGDWDRVADLKRKLERLLAKSQKDEKRNHMHDEQNRLDALLTERDDLDSAITEARLLVTDDENPAPEVEPVVTDTPTTQTAILAEIDRLEAAGKWAEVRQLKAQLVATQSGFGGLSQIAPTPAPALPTLAELNQQIATHEEAGNWQAAGAVKSLIVQRQFVGGH